MASPPHVVDPDNIPGLVNPIMKRYQLQPKDIEKKDNRRGQVVPGKGEFFCPGCGYKWHSYFSWIQIDLIDQRITYRWSMKCKHCLILCKPTFSVPEMEKMIEIAVCEYSGKKQEERRGSGGKMRPFFVRRAPHEAELCEKCGWGQTECWVNWRSNSH